MTAQTNQNSDSLGGTIHWSSSSTHVLLDARLSSVVQERTRTACALLGYPGHLWLASSGSTATTGQGPTMVALTKEAVLASAATVNAWIGSTDQDRWLMSLSSHHIGGLAILARAHLSGASITDAPRKWDPAAFCDLLGDARVTVLSLVPTQLHDLVASRRVAPRHVRCVFLGGAAISPSTEASARELGWPLLRTFGMTETASQIATQAIEVLQTTPQGTQHSVMTNAGEHATRERLALVDPSPADAERELSGRNPMQVLPHLEARVVEDEDRHDAGLLSADNDQIAGRAATPTTPSVRCDTEPERSGRLEIRGASLWTAKLTLRGDETPQIETRSQDWFTTTDRVSLSGRALLPLGRVTDWVKVSGEGVDLGTLQAELESLRSIHSVGADLAIVSCPDLRRGHVLVLAHTGQHSETLWRLLAAFRSRPLPHERPIGLLQVAQIPRSALGKVLRPQIHVDPQRVLRASA